MSAKKLFFGLAVLLLLWGNILPLPLVFGGREQQLFAYSEADSTKILKELELGYAKLHGQPEDALLHFRVALSASKKANSPRFQSFSEDALGRYYRFLGDTASAFTHFRRAFTIAAQQNQSFLEADLHYSQGLLYYENQRYGQALAHLDKANLLFQRLPKVRVSTDSAAALSEKIVLEHESASAAFSENQDYRTLKHHKMLLALGKKQEKNPGKEEYWRKHIIRTCQNIGHLYFKKADYDSAYHFYAEAADLSQKSTGEASASLLARMAEVLFEQKKEVESVALVRESLAQAATKEDLAGLSEGQFVLGKIYHREGQTEQAIEALRQAAKAAKNAGKTQLLQDATALLLEASEGLEKPELTKPFKVYRLQLNARDTLVKINALCENIYRERRRKAEIRRIFSQKERDLQYAKQENARYLRNSYIFVAIMGVAFLGILLLGYTQKRKAHRNILRKKIEIEHQKNELEAKSEKLNQANEELQQQQEELISLNEHLESQKNTIDITYKHLSKSNEKLQHSIRYASDIQAAMLPQEKELNDFFSEFFIFYRPKDVVSGDFYWFSRVSEHKAIMVLSDCTGHGVPGAFMSVLGCTLLHENINVQKNTDNPSLILKNINTALKQILKQKEGFNEDGMDISICTFEKNKSDQIEICFAAAKSNMYIVQDEEMMILKGDRQQIGGKRNQKKEFTNHRYIVRKGALFYMITDGFADQNNAKRRKIGSNKVKQILLENSKLPFGEQKKQLAKILRAHKKREPQRDDISIIGFRC